MKQVLVARPRFRIQVIAAGARGAAGSGGAEVDQLRALVDELVARVEALEAGVPIPTIPSNALTDAGGELLVTANGEYLLFVSDPTPANALTDQDNTLLTDSSNQILTTGAAA